jgi:uncharacterized protein YcfJ
MVAKSLRRATIMNTKQISTRSTFARIAMAAGAMIAVALPLAASATEYQTVERPRQECWNEQVPVQAGAQGYGGAIVGGIAGGLLGNQVGNGNGRTVATAVGAMTGAMVGDRMSGGVSTVSYQNVQRCRTVVDHVQVPVAYQPVEVVRPAPVVYQRVEVVRPVPVVERRVYVVENEEYYYKHKHHKHHHHHHHDDYDD